MKIFITGGAGYIGSTVVSACEDVDHDVVILDNFSTGCREFISGHPPYEGDIAGDSLLNRLFGEQRIDAIVHRAAKIVVPESVSESLAYYGNNTARTVTLLAALQRNDVEQFLFSSSASIYAPGKNLAVTGDPPLQSDSPYAHTRFMMKLILGGFARAGDVRVVSLRYLDPIGIDPKLRGN